MRKLRLQVQISIDGFVGGPNGEMDWMVWDWDDELKNFAGSLTENVDLILLGRKMAEDFVDTWTSLANNPETSDDFARWVVATPKIVFSRSGAKIERANTEVRRGELAGEIDRLKNAEGGDIIVYGGAEFVGSLVKDNLIDEYFLFVNPSALGKGMTIFDALENKLNLKLESSKAFECGISVSVYKSNR